MTSRLLTCSLLEWLQRSWMHSNVFQASRQKAKTTMNWLQHVPFRKLSWKWRLSDKVIMGSLLNHACVNIYEASKLLIYASTIHPFFLTCSVGAIMILAYLPQQMNYISDTFFGAILYKMYKCACVSFVLSPHPHLVFVKSTLKKLWGPEIRGAMGFLGFANIQPAKL